MAINWEMGVSNPIQGINSGLANLGQILAQHQQQERMRPQMELQQLQVEQAKRSATDEAGLRTNLANLQPTVSGGYTDATTGREVPQTSTPANTTKAAYDYWSQKDLAKAEAIADGVFLRAQHLATTTGDHAGAVNMINQKLGFNLKYIGSKGDWMQIANGDGTHALINPSTGEQKEVGTAKPMALSEGAVLVDPSTGRQIAAGSPKPEKQSPMATRDMPLSGGMIQRMQFNPATGKDEPYGVPFKPKADAGMKGDSLGGMAPEDVKHYAEVYNATGNLPSLGMGASPLRTAILKEASKIARGEGKTGGDVAADASNNKAIRGSIIQQEKQAGAMGSFVKNIDKQVTRFEDISKKISSSDVRLLNIPIRQIAETAAGSPDRAMINMYLAEISTETGKLASGATGSVAELSQGAREKWEKIHDPNLSMSDLLKLLKETRHAGQMRMESVNEQLNETKGRLKGGGKTPSGNQSGQLKPSGKGFVWVP